MLQTKTFPDNDRLHLLLWTHPQLKKNINDPCYTSLVQVVVDAFASNTINRTQIKATISKAVLSLTDEPHPTISMRVSNLLFSILKGDKQ